MVPPPKKRPGIGAVGMTKMVNLHPSEPLKTRFGTGYDRDYLSGLIIIGKDRGKVSRKGRSDVDRYSVQHPDFPDVDFFYMACKNFTVLEEGPTPFDNVPVPHLPPTEENVDLMEEGNPLVQPGHNINSEEIAEHLLAVPAVEKNFHQSSQSYNQHSIR
jgi:hypothetical protein